jgi:hypothetical protein
VYELLLFHGNNGYTNAAHCYVIRTLLVSSYRISIYSIFIIAFALKLSSTYLGCRKNHIQKIIQQHMCVLKHIITKSTHLYSVKYIETAMIKFIFKNLKTKTKNSKFFFFQIHSSETGNLRIILSIMLCSFRYYFGHYLTHLINSAVIFLFNTLCNFSNSTATFSGWSVYYIICSFVDMYYDV